MHSTRLRSPEVQAPLKLGEKIVLKCLSPISRPLPKSDITAQNKKGISQEMKNKVKLML